MIAYRGLAGDVDVAAVRDLLIRVGGNTPPGFAWEVRRWDGQRYYRSDPGLDSDWASRIRLWEDGDRLVACVHPEDGGDAWLEVDPAYRHLEEEMLDWAETELRDEQGRLHVHALDDDHPRREVLARRGYVETESGEVTRIRRLPGAQPSPPAIPDGYVIREIRSQESGERQALAALLNAAFGRTGHTEREFQVFASHAPGYRDDLHLVAEAPDGGFAAHVGITFEPTQRVGIVEPVCTHPDHRRRGLARALLDEVIRRVARLGASAVTVGTGIEAAANQLYADAGFELVSTGRWWKLGAAG